MSAKWWTPTEEGVGCVYFCFVVVQLVHQLSNTSCLNLKHFKKLTTRIDWDNCPDVNHPNKVAGLKGNFFLSVLDNLWAIRDKLLGQVAREPQSLAFPI